MPRKIKRGGDMTPAEQDMVNEINQQNNQLAQDMENMRGHQIQADQQRENEMHQQRENEMHQQQRENEMHQQQLQERATADLADRRVKALQDALTQKSVELQDASRYRERTLNERLYTSALARSYDDVVYNRINSYLYGYIPVEQRLNLSTVIANLTKSKLLQGTSESTIITELMDVIKTFKPTRPAKKKSIKKKSVKKKPIKEKSVKKKSIKKKLK